MKKLLIKILEAFGEAMAYILPEGFFGAMKSMRNRVYTGYLKRKFLHFGDSVIMWRKYTLRGRQYISIGDKTVFEPGLQLTATKGSSIKIGDNCLFRRDVHITAVNKITIGNNLLTGTNVIITDNSHGGTSMEELLIEPGKRKAVSKGSVSIGDNVWLGNNVCILPGVAIGSGAVVGANSVVTHDIPAYTVAAGVPARIIKENKQE